MGEPRMKIVEKTTQAPGLCLLSGDFQGPFVDTGCWITYSDPYCYLHVGIAKEIGEAVGMVDGETHEAMKLARDTAEVLLKSQENELVELREQVAAIKTVKELQTA